MIVFARFKANWYCSTCVISELSITTALSAFINGFSERVVSSLSRKVMLVSTSSKVTLYPFAINSSNLRFALICFFPFHVVNQPFYPSPLLFEQLYLLY